MEHTIALSADHELSLVGGKARNLGIMRSNKSMYLFLLRIMCYLRLLWRAQCSCVLCLRVVCCIAYTLLYIYCCILYSCVCMLALRVFLRLMWTRASNAVLCKNEDQHWWFLAVPVPKGFVITCSALTAFLEANNLNIETCTAEKLIAGSLPTSLAQEISTQVIF